MGSALPLNRKLSPHAQRPRVRYQAWRVPSTVLRWPNRGQRTRSQREGGAARDGAPSKAVGPIAIVGLAFARVGER